MKRLISFLLSVVVVMCAILSVAAANDATVDADAAWTDGATVSSAMIAHWNFVGETEEEMLSDKSPHDTSDETMVLANIASVENGIAMVSTAANTNKISAALDGNDFLALQDEMTVYVRFAMKANDSFSLGNTAFINFLTLNTSAENVDNGILRAYATQISAADKTASKLQLRANPGSTSSNNVDPYATSAFALDGKTWVDVAVTLRVDSEADSTECNFYISYDGGKTFEVSSKTTTSGTANALSSVKSIILGSITSQVTLYYDDVKIFNKVLTEEQLKLQVPGAILQGVQATEKDTENNTFDVRFVGSIDSLNYQEIGFSISVADTEKAWIDAADCVYEKLTGTKQEGETAVLNEYTAANVRGTGSYLYALCIEGVPAVGTVTFIVTPYYVVDRGDAPVNGVSFTVVFTDGVYSSSSVYTDSVSET